VRLGPTIREEGDIGEGEADADDEQQHHRGPGADGGIGLNIGQE